MTALSVWQNPYLHHDNSQSDNGFSQTLHLHLDDLLSEIQKNDCINQFGCGTINTPDSMDLIDSDTKDHSIVEDGCMMTIKL